MKNKYGSSLWLATALAYLDRGAAFLCPLIALQFLERGDAYVSIEFVISLSIILATFFDAGLRSHMLYAAKKFDSNRILLISTVNAFRPLLWIQLFGVIIALSIGWIFDGERALLIGFSIARASALTIIGLLVQALIINGRPAYAPLISLTSWALSCAIFLSPVPATRMALTAAFFLGSFIIIALFIIITSGKKYSNSNISSAKERIFCSLSWGWPLLVSALASMTVGNFSKVYAFSNLPSHEVVAFTLWMRAYSIVQLSHSAIISTLILQIYKNNTPGIITDNLFQYLKFLAPAAVSISLIGIFGSPLLPHVPYLPQQTAVFLFLYICFWCIGAYLESYLARDAKNSSILRASLTSSCIYILGILIINPRSSLTLSVVMAVSAFIYSGMIFFAIRMKT